MNNGVNNVSSSSKINFIFGIAKKLVKNPKVYLRKLNIENIKKFFYYASTEGLDNLNNRLDAFDEKYDMRKAKKIEVDPVQELETYDVLEFPIVELPLVSIIIPVYNQFAYTYACLKSILKNTNGISYEVIVADDVSTDKTVDIKEIVHNIIVVRNEQNLRFLLNCNNAAKYAKGKYIHFLNNDTQVQEGWLSSLVQLIESDETIGMVGSKLVYPDGHLQEAGGIVWNDGSAWNYGHGLNPDHAEFNYVKEADYISGASIMVRKSLWREIGGFDELFAPAYYEDTDLAFEVRAHGYKVMYQPLSVVVHFEGLSNGTDTSSGQKQYQVVNAKKFHEKWKDILEREHVANGTQVFKAKDKSLHKKHILVIDHYIPQYDKDAGGKCTWMYIDLFVKLGMKVTFIGDNFHNQEPYTTELTQKGVEFLYGDYYYKNWKSWLKKNADNFDYAYLNRPHIAEKYIDILKENSDCKIIYFGHDLHYLRELRQYEIENNPAILKSSEEWKKKEFALFQKADVIYVVGSYEQQIVQKEFPNKPVHNIPVYIYDQLKENVNIDFEARKDLLFVGGFGHYPNIDAVLWFAENVFPQIKSAYPDIKWYIVGSKPTVEIQELADENIIVTGFIEDAELERLYATCRLAVVPLRIGAGVKGKVVEAVYNKIPLLTSPIGAEGLSLAEEAFVVADCDDSMADKIIALYEDYDALGRLSANCDSFIENHFTLDVAKSIVLQDVT